MTDDFEKRVREHLDYSLQEMQQDEDLANDLASARQKALAVPAQKSVAKTFGIRVGLSAGVSAMALAALMFVVLPQEFKRPDDASMLISELEVLAEGEDLEMLEQDLEFYLWAEAQTEG